MSRTSFKPSLITVAVIGAIALSGCGGGGGGDSDSSASTTPFSASASGVAAKGIIKLATVTAYELNNTGSVVRTVGAAETDASGKYSLTIDSSYTGGPLKLALSAKQDGSTKMVCDLPTCGEGVGYGQDYTLPSTFTLAAYQQTAKSGSVVNAQITPYSNMAAARIEAQIAGGAPLDSALVANAISEVSQIVGINIAEVEPVDITKPEAVAAAGGDALQYAAFNAGIGVLAFGHAGGFEAGIEAVAASFADGKFDGDDAVSIASIVEAVSGVAYFRPELSTAALTATLAAIAENTVDGVYDPEPAPAATQAAVAQAKGMVSQIRTWGTELAKLKDPAGAFALDVETAAAVINSDSGALAGVFGSVMSGAMNTVLTEAESTSGLQARTYTFPITHWTTVGPVVTDGTVQVLDNGGTLKLVISAANSGVDANASVVTNIPSTVLGKSGPLDFVSLTMTVNGGASMTSPAPAEINFANATLNLAYKEGKTRATATDADIASITMAGDVSMAANGVTFAGDAKVGVVSNNLVGDISLEELALNGTFTGPKGSASASASLKLDNAATFDTFGLLNHEPVLWAGNQLPDDAWGIAAAYASANPGDTLQSGYYDYYSNQTCTFGTVNQYLCQAGDAFGLAAKAETALKAEYPTALGMQNVYAGYSVGYGTYYGAMLTFGDFESASNFAQGTITASANVALAGYPSATLTVTAKRTAYTATSPVAGNVVAILSYNGQNLTVEANNTEALETLTITNPDGVKLVVSSGDQVTGDIKVNGEPVGTVSSSSGVPLIRYADGTFESLN